MARQNFYFFEAGEDLTIGIDCEGISRKRNLSLIQVLLFFHLIDWSVRALLRDRFDESESFCSGSERYFGRPNHH